MVVSGLPVDGHLHGDVDPREAARAGMRCIEHLGPGVTVFAAAGTCEQEIRASPPRTIRLPSLRLPGMDRLLEAGPAPHRAQPGRDGHARGRPPARDRRRDLRRRARPPARGARRRAGHLALPDPDQGAHPEVPRRARTRRRSRLRFIAPDEVARWRKSARRFAKLPSRSRQAQRAHWSTQLRLTKGPRRRGRPAARRKIAHAPTNGAASGGRPRERRRERRRARFR